MAAVILGAVVAVVLVAYGALVLARKSRVRAAAAALDADYLDDGWANPGRIAGPRFTIRIAAPRRTFRTHVEVRARNTPGQFLIDAGFFAGWPDWSSVKVPGTRTERAFAFEISLPGYQPPSEGQRQALWQWLNRGSTARRLPGNLMATARVERIMIGQGTVSTTLDGIVTDPSRLRSTLDLLGTLASDGADKGAS